MTLIDDIKRNREAGTPGKWRVEYRHGSTRLIMEDHPDPCQMCDETYYPWVPENLDDWLRIAAVPDMEARILADAAVIKAVEELAETAEELVSIYGAFLPEDLEAKLCNVLAARRKAQEARG